jgi:DNA-directed RNA polymerase specialized sigma24 family protein
MGMMGMIDTHALYERYGDFVYSFCLKSLGNREEAEDVVQ